MKMCINSENFFSDINVASLKRVSKTLKENKIFKKSRRF